MSIFMYLRAIFCTFQISVDFYYVPVGGRGGAGEGEGARERGMPWWSVPDSTIPERFSWVHTPLGHYTPWTNHPKFKQASILFALWTIQSLVLLLRHRLLFLPKKTIKISFNIKGQFVLFFRQFTDKGRHQIMDEKTPISQQNRSMRRHMTINNAIVTTNWFIFQLETTTFINTNKLSKEHNCLDLTLLHLPWK